MDSRTSIAKTPSPEAAPPAPKNLFGQSAFGEEQVEEREVGPMASRPFAAPTAPPPPPPPPNLQARYEAASRFGHNFGNIAVSSPGAAYPETPGGIQAKLAVGKPGDRYEVEADAIADKVMAMPDPAGEETVSGEKESPTQIQRNPIANAIAQHIQRHTANTAIAPQGLGGMQYNQEPGLLQRAPQHPFFAAANQQTPQSLQLKHQVLQPVQLLTDAPNETEDTLVNRYSEEEESEVSLQRKAEATQGQGDVEAESLQSQQLGSSLVQMVPVTGASDKGSDIEGQLNNSKGGGSAIGAEVRDFMEPRFGNDFSDVRIHTGSDAVQMNKDLHAQAFAHGKDIYFNQGKYNPGSDDGKRLLAHELTHVVQQTGAKLQRQQGVQEVTDSTRPSINMQSLPATSNAATSQNGGSSSEAEPTWRDMGNLCGNPPVRSETKPPLPNKKVIEDEGIYKQRRALAEQMLANQRQRAESMLDRRGNITDYRYWFAKVYSFVTDYELKFAESRTFFYPSYVMASVAYFDQIYNDNFNAFSNQGPVENHWRQAFEEAARQKQFTDMLQEQMMHPLTPEATQGAAMAFVMQSVMGAVKSLVSSMQAHIRFDLPRAEAWVFNSYYKQQEGVNLADFRPDFMSMSGVFDNAARDMNQDMAQKLGVPVDLVPQLMQDTAMRQFFDADMVTERADTWHRAEELVSSGNGGADPYRLQDGTIKGNVTQSDNLSGLKNLPTESMRPNMESSAPVLDDDEVCDRIGQMSDSDIAALPAVERMRMIRGLLRGATVGADETTILRILRTSQKSGDVVTIIDGSDAWDMMYSIDGDNATGLRDFFLQHYYAETAQNTAMRLIRKCIEGETAEWEEQMVVDLLEHQPKPNGRALIEQIGQIYQPDGPATGKDASFKNGLYKLEWQLDGAEEERLHQVFGKSDQGWWKF